ncbi:Outer membrane protein AlgE [Pseudomonas chlororaphis]
MSSFVAFTRRVSDGVHIRCCGNGHLGFRPYGDSLFSNAKKVSKKACPSIRCLARARHALTPALLRGPAATGHPWPGAASAASLPRYPLRNACVRPLGKGRVDQGQDQKPRPKPSAFYALLVAAAAGCDRARSARQTRRRGVSGRSRRMVLRLLRSRSQPAAAATGISAKSRPAGRPPRIAFDFLAPSGGRVEVLCNGQLGRDAELATPGRGWPAAVTGISAKSRPTGRSPRVAFDFLAPSGGRVEVLRSGQLGRDAELAAPGHGWPVAAAHGAGPERGNPSPSEDRTLGARAFGYFGLFKVTRRKGETLSGRYRSNGYVHPLRRTNKTVNGHDRSNGYAHGPGQGPEALP